MSCEKTVYHVTGIKNEKRMYVQKVQGYQVIFPILWMDLLKLEKFLMSKSAESNYFNKWISRNLVSNVKNPVETVI